MDSKVKPSLYRKVSEYVRPLWPWYELYDEELVSKGIEVKGWRLITSESG